MFFDFQIHFIQILMISLNRINNTERHTNFIKYVPKIIGSTKYKMDLEYKQNLIQYTRI
jgi:hypothetical protein